MTAVSKLLRDATAQVWDMEQRVQFLEEKVATLEAMNGQLQAALATKNALVPDLRVVSPAQLTDGNQFSGGLNG